MRPYDHSFIRHRELRPNRYSIAVAERRTQVCGLALCHTVSLRSPSGMVLPSDLGYFSASGLARMKTSSYIDRGNSFIENPPYTGQLFPTCCYFTTSSFSTGLSNIPNILSIVSSSIFRILTNIPSSIPYATAVGASLSSQIIHLEYLLHTEVNHRFLKCGKQSF